MSWLDPLLAIKTQQAGTTAGTRQTINFSSGATVTDDPANDRVNVAIAGGLPGVTVTGTPTAGQTVVASSASAASWATIASGLRLAVGSRTDITSTAWTTIGAFTQNWPSPAQYTSWTFSAIASAPSGYTTEVRIFNQTSATAVASSTVSTTALIPTALTSSALTIPTDGSTPLYLVQMRIASGSPTASDIASIFGAYINLS